MPTKAELYAQMADKVATQLTGSWQEWAGWSRQDLCANLFAGSG